MAMQVLSPEVIMGVKSTEEKLFMPGSELQKWFSVSAAKLDKRRLLQLPEQVSEAPISLCLRQVHPHN